MSLNVGILGHVDSGKTTLTRAMAEMASTAAFDKHADSGGRRNTLDLGFSSLTVSGRRLALIDCPGHAGLIKAVLAASSVFDMAIVVVDASSGIQPQTAEHLLLCSIFCPKQVILVLNKIDLVKQTKIASITKKIRKALASLGISEDSPIVPVSLIDLKDDTLRQLMEVLQQKVFEPQRENSGRLVIAVDHCFPVTGKGTVMTGTVIDGCLRVNQEIEIPVLKEKRKVKGLESWKEPVEQVTAGERAAILVQQLNAQSISRTMVCSPGALTEMDSCIASAIAIPFYRGTMSSGMKVHVSIGFEIVMAECQFLRPDGDEYEQLSTLDSPCVLILSTGECGRVASAFEKEVKGKGLTIAFVVAVKDDCIDVGIRDIFCATYIVFSNSKEKLKRLREEQRRGHVEPLRKHWFSMRQVIKFKAETFFVPPRSRKMGILSFVVRTGIETLFARAENFRKRYHRDISLNLFKLMAYNSKSNDVYVCVTQQLQRCGGRPPLRKYGGPQTYAKPRPVFPPCLTGRENAFMENVVEDEGAPSDIQMELEVSQGS
ncbi:unnamed protein product [Cylicocyclus nassatus]|uniref:Tr-type G domain-containing protein n=1 Tax=Cylicocyclus nassatus TaxID=53992 RepID=A0AA36DTS9_CYLNA|nr:unnamed protein product [Cylicocyclus nassatus]